MAAGGETLILTGFEQTIRRLREAEPATRRELRGVLRQVGDNVKQEAASLFEPYDAKTAAGYRTYVRQRGIAVEQSLRKTTGLRPKFGALQMRKALLPALHDNEDDVTRRTEQALDRVCAGLDRS